VCCFVTRWQVSDLITASVHLIDTSMVESPGCRWLPFSGMVSVTPVPYGSGDYGCGKEQRFQLLLLFCEVFHLCWGLRFQHWSDRKVTCFFTVLSLITWMASMIARSVCFFDASLDDFLQKQIMNHTGKIFIQQFRPSVALIIHLKASWWPIEASRMLLMFSVQITSGSLRFLIHSCL